MIVKMAKIRILGPKSQLTPVLDLLQELGAIHIESKPPDVLRMEEIQVVRRFTVEEITQQTKATLEALLNQVKKILLALPHPSETHGYGPAHPPLEAGEASLQKLTDQLKPIVSRVESLVGKRKVHEDELSLLARYEKILQVLSPLISMVRESHDLEFMGLAIQAEQRHVIPILEQALSRLTGGHYEIFYREVDKETLAGLLVFPKTSAAQVKALLWGENIGELRLPASITNKPLGEALKITLRKRLELPERIRKLDRELAELSQRWYGMLEQLRRWLENKIEQIMVSASFYETKMTFIIYGWIPQTALSKLQEHLGTEFQSRVIVEQLLVEKSEEDRIPVTLSNPSLIHPFEIFTRVLPLPRYGTIDPTPFIAAFFPLFFGMIIGDIGYGLILLIAAVLARKRYRLNPLIGDLALICSWAAASSVLWGIAYGEFFGDLGERWGLHPVFFNRMEDLMKTLFIAVAMGVVHILLGIGLGIFTALRQGRRHEMIAKFTGLVLVVAFLTMMSGILGWLPRTSIPISLTVILASLPVLILGGGPSAAMELHNLVNILSYLRLMGIGVASVSLAFAANQVGELMGNVFLGILMGSILHTVNLGFGIFSPTIQSLRLHYVEFFENFFQGGGCEYRPFQKLT